MTMSAVAQFRTRSALRASARSSIFDGVLVSLLDDDRNVELKDEATIHQLLPTIGYVFRLAVVTLVMLVVNGCTGHEAEQAALDEFQSTVELGSGWGLTELRVFGRSTSPIPVLDWMAAGQIESISAEGSPGTYTVVIPFWCEGKTLEGLLVSRKREVTMTVIDIGDWQVQKDELTYDEDLGLLRQIVSWLGWSTILPLLLLLMVVSSGGAEALRSLAMMDEIQQQWGEFRWLPFLFQLIVVGASSYIAYVCFGKVSAVVACGLVQAGLSFGLAPFAARKVYDRWFRR
jgi:hypothetical protein